MQYQKKSCTFALVMKRTQVNLGFKTFFLLLFVAYTGTSIFFTHAHIVNHTVYIHTHPYKKSEKKEHSHTTKEMLALQQIAQMPISERAVAIFNFTILQPTILFCSPLKDLDVFYIEKSRDVLLRAPPIASLLF